MKIAFFDTKNYDKPFFEQFKKSDMKIKYYETKLNEDTCSLAKGYDVVCVFVNDDINKNVIDKLIEYNVKMIALRCAGYNNVDIKYCKDKILVARVDAILRRVNLLTNDTVLSVGGIEINKSAHVVTIGGKSVDLSYKEFELLSYFVENKGIALSREKILNNVWNYDYFGDARTIDTHVKKLRNKMGEYGDYIKTIWGMGYKFEVEE